MTCRNFCFTSYDIDKSYEWILDPPVEVRYMVWNQEICPDTNRKHLQGYCETFRPHRFEGIKKFLGEESLHIEKRRGSREEATAYCKKIDSRDPDYESYFEIGTWISGQGARGDLEALKVSIKRGADDAELCEEHFPVFIKYAKMIPVVRQLLLPAAEPTITLELRTWQTWVLEMLESPIVRRKIIWIWSYESGTGKSTFHDYVKEQYGKQMMNGCQRMIDTLYMYNKQKCIWFDTARASPHDAEFLSQIENLSNGGYHNSTKYECIEKLVTAHIVVSSNRPPPHDKLPSRIVEVVANNE